MVLEKAELFIKEGLESEFEKAFDVAKQIIASMPGYITHSLSKCLEDPHKYLLLVEWKRLEDHVHGFRKSEEYQKWKELLHHFYDPFPVVEHYSSDLIETSREVSLVGIDHVQVAIPKLGEVKAREFYCEALGFVEIEKPENLKRKGGLWVKTGRDQLHLGILEPFVPAKKAHPAFEVKNIGEFRTKLGLKGIEVYDEDELPGAERFYLSDPFGNRLEFLEWKSKSK